jgi:hypothetical protein
VAGVLGETVRLLVSHLHLFTLVALTVWLPGHVARHYIEFFESGAEASVESFRLGLTIQVIFDPLVVAATLAALSRIKQGQPVGYRIAMLEGLAAWARLFPVRFVVYLAVLLPTLGAALLRPGGPVVLAAGLGLLGLGVLTIVLVMRFAVIDSVVVLEGATMLTGWRRAAELTRGRRWAIFRTLAILFVLTLAAALLASQLFARVHGANHFVVRVLFDCALAVGQTLFTIALFLHYWRARMGAVPVPAPAP